MAKGQAKQNLPTMLNRVFAAAKFWREKISKHAVKVQNIAGKIYFFIDNVKK